MLCRMPLVADSFLECFVFGAHLTITILWALPVLLVAQNIFSEKVSRVYSGKQLVRNGARSMNVHDRLDLLFRCDCCWIMSFFYLDVVDSIPLMMLDVVLHLIGCGSTISCHFFLCLSYSFIVLMFFVIGRMMFCQMEAVLMFGVYVTNIDFNPS